MKRNTPQEVGAPAGVGDATLAALLAQAYPGLEGRGAGAPAPDSEQAAALAMDFITDAYPEYRCALMFGSYAKGQQKPFSDIDVLVLLPAGMGTEKRRLVHRGVPLELFVVTERTLLEGLALSRRVGLRVFFDALNEGVVLSDRENVLPRLRTLARNEVARPLDPPDEAARRQFRLHITQNLVKLSQLATAAERIQLAGLLYNAMTFAVLRIETGWAYRNERLPREFGVHDPVAAQALNAGLLALGAGEGSSAFLRIGAELLDRVGGPLWHGTSEAMFKLSSMPA